MRGVPRPLVAVAAATVVLLAGCGGGPSTYTAAKTRSCLEKAGVDITAVPKDDFVASSSEGGAFQARFRDDKVTVSIALDRAGAEAIVRGYERFRGKNIGLEDVLKVKKNAVMLWALHPPDAYLQTIEGCLK